MAPMLIDTRAHMDSLSCREIPVKRKPDSAGSFDSAAAFAEAAAAKSQRSG